MATLQINIFKYTKKYMAQFDAWHKRKTYFGSEFWHLIIRKPIYYLLVCFFQLQYFEGFI